MCLHQLYSGLLRRRLQFRRSTLCLFSADKAALTCVALCTSHELCLNGKVSTVHFDLMAKETISLQLFLQVHLALSVTHNQ